MCTTTLPHGPQFISKGVGDTLVERKSRNKVSPQVGVLKDIQCFHNDSSQPVVTAFEELTCVQFQSETPGLKDAQQGVSETVHL